MIEFLLIYSTLQCFSRHHQVECTLLFFFSLSFGFFFLFIDACLLSSNPTVFVMIVSILRLCLCSFSRVLSSDYSAKPCLNSFLQLQEHQLIFRCLLSSNLSLVIFLLSLSFFDIPLSSFVSATLLLKEKTHTHTQTILSHIIFYLFVAFGLSLSLFFHSQTFSSAACAFLVVCFGP